MKNLVFELLTNKKKDENNQNNTKNESKPQKKTNSSQTKAISIEHKGSYSKLRDVYAFAMNYIKEKGYTIADKPREVYVNGCWDCESEDDYITLIQIPIK